MSKKMYFVTRVDVRDASTKTIVKDEDRDIALASFQTECMDPNIVVPTPILFEQQLIEDNGRSRLLLLGAAVLMPPDSNMDWTKIQGLEEEYQKTYEVLKNLHQVIRGYTQFGEDILNNKET